MSQSNYNRDGYKGHHLGVGRKISGDRVRGMMILNSNNKSSYYWNHDSKPIEWGTKSAEIAAAMRSENCWDIIDPSQAPINCTDANREISFTEILIYIEEHR